MPVSLYDGNAYIVDNNENIERTWALSFFLNGHIDDYLLLYDECGKYNGMISYKSLLASNNLETAVIYQKLYVGDQLWSDARTLFCDDKNLDAVPVFNENMEILYFAKYDKELVRVWEKVYDLDVYVDKEIWKTFDSFIERVHIRGLNDVLFRLREWLVSLGVEVSVEGEGWSLFRIKSSECMGKNIVIIDKECRWVDYVHTEYWNWLEQHYGVILRKKLCKPYIAERKEKVMFYLSNYPYLNESLEPLISLYLRSDKECICIFPCINAIMAEGHKNITNMIKIIEKIEAIGGKCHIADEQGLLCNQYILCFFLSEYSGRIPIKLRSLSCYVIALQATAIYTHMYQVKGRFEEVFSEESRQNMDYLIASDYIADWIYERDKTWEDKILRFGYPKLDSLYLALNRKCDIPNNWINRIEGKKVYLFTTYEMEQLWLDFFADKEDDKIAIWRPHPLQLERRRAARFEEISKKYNVIIDNSSTYYASFQISSAMISSLNSSVATNYLYTGKPICIYNEKEVYKSAVIDYRKESWYKSAYNALCGNDVLEFINSIQRGYMVISEEQALCRKQVTSNFDGKVCNRIYDYFNKKKICN